MKDFKTWWRNVGIKEMPKADEPPAHGHIAHLAWDAATEVMSGSCGVRPAEAGENNLRDKIKDYYKSKNINTSVESVEVNMVKYFIAEAVQNGELEDLVKALLLFDDIKYCRMGCGKIDWGEEKHANDCPFNIAYKLKSRFEA